MNDQLQDPARATSRHPLEVVGAVELAVLVRSGMAESRHVGAAVVVEADGTILREAGDTTASIYPRSTLKPFQALSVLRSGVALDGPQAVLATASHSATPAHQEVVTSMLDRIDATDDDLLCPEDWPGDRETARTVSRKRRLYMNCSGKHAGFLLACAENGWDPATYDSIDHPLQAAARAAVEEYTGETIDHAGVDGCGAPVFAVTLRGLSSGIAKLTESATSDRDAHAGHLVRAVLADPWALDGHGRANTVTMEELGVFAKLGAEGVIVLGTTSGIGVAVKVLDGNLRAGTLAALALLVEQGVVDGEAARRVLDRTLERITGGGVVVGGFEVGAGLLPMPH